MDVILPISDGSADVKLLPSNHISNLKADHRPISLGIDVRRLLNARNWDAILTQLPNSEADGGGSGWGWESAPGWLVGFTYV